ncbi:hypothetical protein D0Z00_004316 [Geotrichum galactomycetum]|uniref:Uncharacterized protein n=1 Tax=Geotrichum galactomycetum TaxID=27317 RepID=A0ACB6UYT1_9ASCO|nr:hypothetical protein D0Z00_004316 [Geotrichum candidum]
MSADTPRSVKNDSEISDTSNHDRFSEINNDNDESSESVQDSPFELTLQSLLAGPLDTTIWRLKGVRDSQVALTTQLNLLMTALATYRNETRPVKLKDTVEQIKDGKKRLQAINTTLAVVESRIRRIRDRLVADQQQALESSPRRVLG